MTKQILKRSANELREGLYYNKAFKNIVETVHSKNQVEDNNRREANEYVEKLSRWIEKKP